MTVSTTVGNGTKLYSLAFCLSRSPGIAFWWHLESKYNEYCIFHEKISHRKAPSPLINRLKHKEKLPKEKTTFNKAPLRGSVFQISLREFLEIEFFLLKLKTI